MCFYHICMIPSSVDKHLGCFHVLAVLYIVLLRALWCVPLVELVFLFFSGCIPRRSFIIRKTYKSSLKQKFKRKLFSEMFSILKYQQSKHYSHCNQQLECSQFCSCFTPLIMMVVFRIIILPAKILTII